MRTRNLTLTAVAAACAAALALAGCSSKDGGSGTSPSASASSGKTFRIGISQIVDHPSLNLIKDGFKDVLAAEGIAVEYDDQNAQGEASNAATIAGGFAADADIDLVLAIATPTAQAVVQQIKDRPVLFAGITDPVAAQLVPSLTASGGNVTGTSDLNPNAKPVELVKQLVPDVKTIGVLYSSAETNSEVQVEAYKAEAAPLGIEIRPQAIANSSEVATGAEALAGVDAILVPTDNTVVSALEAVIAFAQRLKIPLFSADAESVVKGTVATRGISYYDLGKRTGEMAVEILKNGKNPGDIDTLVVQETELKVNPAAAAAMGVTIPADILKDAVDVTTETAGQ